MTIRYAARRVLSQGQGPLTAKRLRSRLAAPSPVVRDRFAVA